MSRIRPDNLVIACLRPLRRSPTRREKWRAPVADANKTRLVLRFVFAHRSTQQLKRLTQAEERPHSRRS